MKILTVAFLTLFTSSVLATPKKPWTPDSKKKWEQGETIFRDSNYRYTSSDIPSVHLVILDSNEGAYMFYKDKYLNFKNAKNPKNVYSYLYDRNTDTFSSITEEFKNKEAKLTIVTHGSREVQRLPGTHTEFGVKYRIGNKSSKELAALIKQFTEQVGFRPLEQMRFIVCNAGTQAASNYMSDFLKEINNRGIKISSAVAYRTKVTAKYTVNVVMSTVSEYFEELSWAYEQKGKELSDVQDKLTDNGITLMSDDRRDKNKMRMIYTLKDGKVLRNSYKKKKNRRQHQLDTNINLENDKAEFERHYQNSIYEVCNNIISGKRKNVKRRRIRSPSVCSLTEHKIEKDYVINENTLTIEDGEVKVKLVNRYDPDDTHLVSYPLEESFHMKQEMETKEHITSLVKKGGTEILERINKVMSIYGIAAGFLGAGKFFAENNTVRGALTLTQSLHELGEVTSLNKQLSRISQKVFQKSLQSAASKVGMKKALTKISGSVERLGKSAAGQFLKGFPIVGMSFDGYSIAEGVKAIEHIDRSDPNQEKYFGLEATNLALDVTTTALSISELAFPPAAVVLQPIIIALTIVRMSIGDFYCDIVSELDKLPQGANDLDKMKAVMKGLGEGAGNFVTGGFLRAKKALDEEVKQNQELLRNLSKVESYYKITADDGNTRTLNLMEGILSQHGGFVTVQLLNNGSVTVQVGGVDNGSGGVKTIKKTFYDPSLQNIVLGVGESAKFVYTQKAAHLFWVIPVYHAKVISGEIKLHSSMFGTYYGNDKDNMFFAIDQPPKDPDMEFVIKNYHYTIYGHGGDDSFFLGPQTSVLSGGEGRDIYVFPTSGTHADIDNFSHDMLEDHLLIKAPFSRIDCTRRNTDLVLVYGSQGYKITIRNWFVHSSAEHYQHMTFQSADGVMFKVTDKGLSNGKFHAMCEPETLDKSKSGTGVSVRLTGEFKSVINVIGSKFPDTIVGNEKNNVFNGGHGPDTLEGGEGADTYEIFQGQGCDTINNYAKDEKLDVVVFRVPFSSIHADLQGEDLQIVDKVDVRSTCVRLKNWNKSKSFQHATFLSSDHVTFHISTNEGELTMTALMVDLSQDSHGSTVNLSDTSKHLLYVLTIFDSAYDDVLIGNALGNFLSCTGGRDHLQGAGGSDKYVIKSGCKQAYIFNLDEDLVSDVLFLEHPFSKIRATYQWPHIILKVVDSDTEVHLQDWLKGKEFQHLALQTIDGVISMIASDISEPKIITPFEINLSQENCEEHTKTFDLGKDPFSEVRRFKAKSSNCSYSVIGNSEDNYIDPGIGNAMKHQYLMGDNGSDTYFLGHEYGYENEINNEATDMKTDYLFLEVHYNDITVLLQPPHVILSSRSRNDYIRVRLLKYLQGPEHQHLVVKSSDGFLFQVNPLSYPYKSVLSIDTSTSTKSCNISCAEGDEFLTVSQIYGASHFSNYITGSKSSSLIKGGNKNDYLQGNEGNERIEGDAGDDVIKGENGEDILLGGEGDDEIMGGAGNDLIYGGWGADKVDGGPGVDTVFFSGDVKTSTGVKVDLNLGKGEWADAENDTYTGVEAVSGTNFNDLIIGDDEDNDLQGKFGNDTLIPGHGTDLLFGGPGNDLYVLDDCSGVKHINNFASDKAQDYILLRDFSHNDACFFLLEGNLVIAFSYQNPVLSLIQQNDLTVLLENWNNDGSFNQHVEFVFANDTMVDSSFFTSAAEISPTLSEINSTMPTLHVRSANETAVEIEVKTLNKLNNKEYKIKYHLEVSDELFFSDSLHWDHQPLIIYSGLQSGVLYTFQFHVTLCEFPLLVLAETTQRTNPNPPTSVTVTHVSHSNAFIRWTAPSPDSDPSSREYSYVVHVNDYGYKTVRQITTGLTSAEITDLKPGTEYKVSVSSTISGIISQEKSVHMKTSNYCPTYSAPVGTRVIGEKMTSRGPAVLIACEEGYSLTSGPEILCLEKRFSRPCVPRRCNHEYNVIPHGSFVERQCLTNKIQSQCLFGHFKPPIPVCCHMPSIAHIEKKYRTESYIIAVDFSCPHGYWLSGPSHLDCDLKRGQWSQSLFPSCYPIPCPDPPQDPHGRFRSLSRHSDDFKEGDILKMECDANYHPTKDRITCRNGEWEQSNCEPNVRLIETNSQSFKLYGKLQQWKSGTWTSRITSAHAENLARFSCENRELVFVKLRLEDLLVECSMVKLETSGREYSGKAKVNLRNGWESVCFEGITEARTFCRLLYPGKDWTVSLPGSTLFHAAQFFHCDEHLCSMEKKPQTCYKQIQCRSMCDPFRIPNGQSDCENIFDGDSCSVSCNRLYNLQGPFQIRCTSDGWSDSPYCIESVDCGSSHEPGPHSVGCLTKLWTEIGCSVESKLSPTKRRDFWKQFDNNMVVEVKSYMVRLLLHSSHSYDPDCQVDKKCFPRKATVLTSDGTHKSMSELKVGDKVLALDSYGNLVYSEVILWLDRRPSAEEHYILLTTEGISEPLSMSPDHVTFIATSNGTAASVATMIPVFAKDLRPGHLIHRYDPTTGLLVAHRVTIVQESKDLGAYAPLTVEGNLIVDGHLVSCYALQCLQYFAHLPFAPYRFLHTLRSYVPFFESMFPVQHEQEEEGMHWYASALYQVGQWFGYPFGETCYPRELRLYHYP